VKGLFAQGKKKTQRGKDGEAGPRKGRELFPKARKLGAQASRWKLEWARFKNERKFHKLLS